jgi:predicted polyphosphate/ATP-dependent NAD kinase
MPDGKRLWEYANENFLHIKILSALGIPDENIKDGKLEWIGRNLRNIDADDIILVVNSTDKIKYAGQNQILVDDKEKTITSWIAAGGIGILHKNTNKTIQKLTKYI